MIFLLYIYIFTISLKVFPISLGKIMVLALGVRYIFEVKKIKLKLNNYIYMPLIILFLAVIIFIFTNLINFSNDYSVIFTTIMMFLECFIGSYFFSYFIIKNKKENILDLIATVTFFEAVFVIFFYFFPEIRNYVYFNIIEANMNFDLSNIWFNRGIGLGSAGANLSVIEGIGLLCSVIKIEKMKNKVYSIFQIIAIIMSGRTGQMCVIIFIFFLILFSMKQNKESIILLKKILKNICYLIPVILISVFFLRKDERIVRMLQHSLELFFNIIYKHNFSTESTNNLKQMIFLPTDIKTLIIGDGKYIDNGHNYMCTDSGYIRSIFYSGLVGTIFYYSFYISVFYKTLKNIDKNLKNWYKIIFILFFIIEIKEPFLYRFTCSKIIFLIYWYFYLKKEKIKGREIFQNGTISKHSNSNL